MIADAVPTAFEQARPSADPRETLAAAVRRYRSGEYRATIFRDLVLEDIENAGPNPVVLDIGCGHGFDGNEPLQRSLAEAAERYIGLEPDAEILAPPYVDEFQQTTLEGATLAAGSVNVAFSAFVLEHVETPELFWRHVYDALAPGGVFWGFTVDLRHYFGVASRTMSALHVKDLYLRLLRGRRGAERYENYRTYYRANTPRAIARFTTRFRRVDTVGFGRVGQTDYYFPRWLRPAVHLCDAAGIVCRLPSYMLVTRLVK